MIAGKLIGTISSGKIGNVVLMLFLCGISTCCFSQTVVLKDIFGLADINMIYNLI